jgi:hypothetical protein
MDPIVEISRMFDFCQSDYDGNNINSLANKVITPNSIGRFRQFGRDCFREDDFQFVSEMGFPISLIIVQ